MKERTGHHVVSCVFSVLLLVALDTTSRGQDLTETIEARVQEAATRFAEALAKAPCRVAY
jgi:hypothetical protein